MATKKIEPAIQEAEPLQPKTNWDSLVENVSQSEGYNTILENKVLFSMGVAIILILAIGMLMFFGKSMAVDVKPLLVAIQIIVQQICQGL